LVSKAPARFAVRPDIPWRAGGLSIGVMSAQADIPQQVVIEFLQLQACLDHMEDAANKSGPAMGQGGVPCAARKCCVTKMGGHRKGLSCSVDGKGRMRAKPE
jgi:hypothetical protein